MTAVLFGNVEEAVTAWVGSQIAEPVGDRVYKVTKDKLPFVVVERLGGPYDFITEDATLTIEAWAKGYGQAWDMALRARQAVHSIVGQRLGGIVFYKVDEFGGPGRLHDDLTNTPRVVFTVSIRARALTG